MAKIFQNNEFTTIILSQTGVPSAGAGHYYVEFTLDEIYLYSQRELIGISQYAAQFLPAFGGAGDLYTQLQYMLTSIEVLEPLNRTVDNIGIASSFPPYTIAPTLADLPNRAYFGGNGQMFSFAPIPLRRFVIRTAVSDQMLNAVGQNIIINLTLFWQEPEKWHFVGEKKK